jgi:hypothetical protein
MSEIKPGESVLTFHMRQIVEGVEDQCIRAYHESYAHMHPNASETVRRADADDFMRRVREPKP